MADKRFGSPVFGLELQDEKARFTGAARFDKASYYSLLFNV